MHCNDGRTGFHSLSLRFRGTSGIVCIFQRIWGRKITTKIQRKARTHWSRLDKFYVERNNLSLNDPTKLSGARYNAAKNPFVIYHFCNILGNTMKDLGIENRPYLFWKCDESGLPHEPKKCKVIIRSTPWTKKVQGYTWKGTKDATSKLFHICIYIVTYQSCKRHWLFFSTKNKQK